MRDRTNSSFLCPTFEISHGPAGPLAVATGWALGLGVRTRTGAKTDQRVRQPRTLCISEKDYASEFFLLKSYAVLGSVDLRFALFFKTNEHPNTNAPPKK